MVDAGGREVRVSSPDRVIFPATERTAEVTKLDIVRYYVASATASCARSRGARRRSSAGRRACTRGSSLSTREQGGGDAFYQKRIPKGAPDYVETARIEFPSGRHADEVCPTELAVVAWAAPDGHDHLPPVAGAPRRRRPSRRAAPRPRPAAGHRLRRRRPGRRRGARAAGRARLHRLSRRPRAAAACTSTCGSSRAGRSPTSATPRSPSGASSSGGCPAR